MSDVRHAIEAAAWRIYQSDPTHPNPLRAAQAITDAAALAPRRDHETVEWGDLERLARAATPGPWEARRDGLTDGMRVVHDREHVSNVAEVGVYGAPRAEEDAEFIAAANPATILRLIEALRQERVCYTDECGEPCRSHVALLWAERDTARKKAGLIGQRLGKVRAERDALAARLAAVEAERDALADEITRVRAAVAQALRQHPDDLTALEVRAALAAPTDTTREN